MYCTCDSHPYRNNPIVPDRLYKVLAMAIWPIDNTDPGQARASLAEAEAARKMAIRFLVAVQPIDLPQLKEIVDKIMAVAASKPETLLKFLELYQEAVKRNSVLPSPNKPKARPSGRSPKPGLTPRPVPKPSGRPREPEPEPEGRRAPRPREACRACDGRGFRTKVDKENVMKEIRTICSVCGGTGREPPPSTGRGRGFGRRGPHVEETEEEEDINRKADNFLRRHGLDRWGRGSSY
jgi:hypothetical protein